MQHVSPIMHRIRPSRIQAYPRQSHLLYSRTQPPRYPAKCVREHGIGGIASSPTEPLVRSILPVRYSREKRVVWSRVRCQQMMNRDLVELRCKAARNRDPG